VTLATLLFVQGCGSLFFYPKKQLFVNPIALQFSPQDIYFKSSDDLTLHGWFFRAQASAKGTILVLHGNAENLSTHVNSVLWLIPQGFNIFIFDCRGYGRSEGKPSISGVHQDAEAALETVLNMPETKGGKIVVLGQSIGGAIAVYTVAHTVHRNKIAALVIDSAFASYRLIAREKLGDVFLTWPFQYPLSYLVSDSYSPIRHIKDVYPVPILVLHGTDDPVVPEHHGRMLFEAAREPKLFIETPTPGHIMAFADEEVRKQVIHFIANCYK
jgi:uncharacterized protein